MTTGTSIGLSMIGRLKVVDATGKDTTVLAMVWCKGRVCGRLEVGDHADAELFGKVSSGELGAANEEFVEACKQSLFGNLLDFGMFVLC
jgi:hypothetical protein